MMKMAPMRQTEAKLNNNAESVAQAITRLATIDNTHLYAILTKLNNLSPSGLALLNELWPTLEVERRRLIVRTLRNRSKHNFKFNFDDIFKIALSDPDTVVQSQAIAGLAECEDPELVGTIIRILNSSNTPEVQLAAISVLANFALLVEIGKISYTYADKLANCLLEIARSPQSSTKIRCHALEAAAPLNLQGVHEAILDFYYSNSPTLKISAIHAMGKNGAPQWAPLLFGELNCEDPARRSAAATAYGEMGDPEVITHLINLLHDSNFKVILAAVQALGKIGNPEAKEDLLKLLQNPNQTIRKAANEAINEIDSVTEIIPPLNE